MFNTVIREKNADHFDLIMYVGFKLSLFNLQFVPILNQVLLEDWHYKHKDIVDLLSKYHDNSSTQSLYLAAQMHLEYFNYDETNSLASRCIYALSFIGTQDAINALRLLSNNTDIQIAHYAKNRLEHM